MSNNVLVTGGLGFIGSNLVRKLVSLGKSVVVLDDFSRHGVGENLDWLRGSCISFEVFKGDISVRAAVEECFQQHGPFDEIYHLAAQVAVTTSVREPRRDFEINALGTLNLLEAVRIFSPSSVFVYSSTNKVYGDMKNVSVVERSGRYEYENLVNGVSENEGLDLYSPYGCSKGAADQYVLDYHRIFGLQTVVFRQSCIYGPRQMGVEDQGWLAWFLIAAHKGMPITIYGDGKQVRDVLFVDDLIDAYLRAVSKIDLCAGQAFNVGGGQYSLSLLELVHIIKTEINPDLEVAFDQWRPGDQKVFICDVSKARSHLGWSPTVSPKDGIKILTDWIKASF